MQTPWWQYRQWRFLADMNGDGLVTTSDALLWAQWFFFLPGDAFIAQFGTTPLGTFLEVTPASFGSMTSAALSAALWLLAIGAAFYVPRFFVDILDPTSRQQRRERRQARRAQRHAKRAQVRHPKPQRFVRRDGPLPFEERREPRFENVSAESSAEAADLPLPVKRALARAEGPA
jgi:hypothetical protein